MTAQLSDLLQHVLAGEPALGDEVDAVFRQAELIRRRRTRLLLTAGAVIAGAIILVGYLLTTTLLPARGATPAATPSHSPAPMPSAMSDPVLRVIAPIIDGQGMRIVPRPPERGLGWRQYSVLGHDGRLRGVVEVAVYAVPGRLCFPVPGEESDCATAERAADGVEFVRYDDTDDPDWQVNETIARRTADGRTVAVMAAGERGTGDAAAGRPALTGAQVRQIATDIRLISAFGPHEQCNGPAEGACPVFEVPVPTSG